MTRRAKQPPTVEPPAPDVDTILQVKVWLLGVSPMVWRRLLVPSSYTLRELHGVIQVAMGWEGHRQVVVFEIAKGTRSSTAAIMQPWQRQSPQPRS